MFSVEGKVVVVTGAASGFGEAVSRTLTEVGARVVASDINEQGLVERHPDLLTMRCDVSVASDCQALIEAAVAEYGRLDGVVNNAGIAGNGDVVECSEEVWDRTIDVNLKGMFLVSKYAVPELRKAGGGAIVNIASIGGFWGEPGIVPYNAAKGGVIGLTRAMAMDHAPENIRVNTICPGYHETGMPLAYFEDQPNPEMMRQQVADIIASRRMGRPEELAATVVFLLSDANHYMQGSVLITDGGVTAGYPWHQLTD